MLRRRFAIHLGAALAALLLLAPASASADVIGAPPDRCPEGSTPESDHGGSYCAPASCTTDAECSDGRTCRDGALCQEERHGASGGGPFTFWAVTGPCGADDSCPQGGTCKRERYCQSTGGSPAGKGGTGAKPGLDGDEPAKKSGCSAAGVRGGSGLALLVVVAALWRRRRGN